MLIRSAPTSVTPVMATTQPIWISARGVRVAPTTWWIGASGFLSVIGSIVEITKGDLKLDQLFAIADGDWAAEWERAVFGRDGKTLEQYNSFVYRFEQGRIAEMWMIGAGNPEDAAFFA